MDETKEASRELTIEDFIQEFLIDEIREIKKEHPYMAFILMASGIEFLGRYIKNDLTNTNKGKQCFNCAIQKLSTLRTYLEGMGFNVETDDLYSNFRCGLIHQFRLTTTQMVLSNKNVTNDKTIDCDRFYDIFKNACEEAIKLVAKENRESVPFIYIKTQTVDGRREDHTGTTPYNKTFIDNNKKDKNKTK